MATNKTLRRLTLLCLLLLAPSAGAHVGTSSVFVQGNAGPYPVYVTVTPPAVIPGQAMVSVIWAASPSHTEVTSILAEANVLAAVQAGQMPQGLKLTPGPIGSHEFHGTVWIMAQGSWQVRLHVEGPSGRGTIAVPLPASPVRLMRMSKPFGAMLLVLGIVLIAGFCAIAAALAREAQQDPGTDPTPSQHRAGRRAALFAAVLVTLLLLAWLHLWRQEIARYSTTIYKPLAMDTALGADHVLHLHLHSPSLIAQAMSARPLDDLVPDHNHLMHLYLVRWPAMDVVFHLHPTQTTPGDFTLPPPAMPAGPYRLFADVVHSDGFPETAVAALNLPALDAAYARPLAGDDASGLLPALLSTPPASTPSDIPLPDGYLYRFTIETPAGTTQPLGTLTANTPVLLRCTLLDPHGNPPPDMQNYMGMLGHMAILKSDGSVFAHIHPEGSAAMAAYMLANPATTMPPMDRNMPTPTATLPNVTSFPFGFPTPGTYRLIIQMKHGPTVETGATDITIH